MSTINETIAGAGFVGTMIGNYLGYVPGVVAVAVGVLAIISYSITIYDRFSRRCNCKEHRHG